MTVSASFSKTAQPVKLCVNPVKNTDDKDDIDEQVSSKLQLKKLHEIMCKVLHGREKIVILMRYGLGPAMEEMTQREIAIALDISRSYVSRIEKKALSKLRKEMSEKSRT
jgi:RNA polymerase sporulation-specific sigma factor